ncbi:MAG: hypothetical protein B6D34_11800 [Candidatus Brocadia sp. UTAMX1]|nr:MAG: hypothetical protein B6D34_11800 [Candidatus Brocadia sp. UTAMX1]
MIENSFPLKRDDIQLMKENTSFFCFFWRNEREGISPCWPIVIFYKSKWSLSSLRKIPHNLE